VKATDDIRKLTVTETSSSGVVATARIQGYTEPTGEALFIPGRNSLKVVGHITRMGKVTERWKGFGWVHSSEERG
jgi:hypothetical protein